MRASKREALLCVLVCAIVCLCTSAALADQDWELGNYPGPPHQGAGYLYTYFSLVQYGYGYPAYYYNYTLQNNSNQYDIVSWTWFSGSASGTVFPHPKGAEYVDGYDLPLMHAADDADMQYRVEDNDSVSCPPVEVTSIITWSDSHQTFVPIYVPECVIPEPASAVALLIGILGLAPIAMKRTKR